VGDSSSATPGATFAVDGPSDGRGAWLCRADDGEGMVEAQCLEAAIVRKQFARAWKIGLDHDDVEAIRGVLRHDK
jgi:predicted RNA-binding protein YlxR (DUF448 family)